MVRPARSAKGLKQKAKPKFSGNTNWENRTLFHGDNLDFLRAMNSESVDLIATDPPFNKGKDFHSTPDSLRQDGGKGKFQDRWSWKKDVHTDWLDQIKDDWPAIWEVIDAANAVHMKKTKRNIKLPREEVGSDMGAFLCFIAVRLLEMHRVLQPTGSIYLHCDPTASHYLKAIMDAIFGHKNFVNEVLWLYKTGGMSKRWFGRKHDNILFYAKGKNYLFNPQREKSYLSHNYGFSNVEILQDEQGVYTMVGMRDYWDIPALRGNQPETVGYPTQKPVALYERIVNASSNEGDIVLDPFCGCATTLVAAERLNRQWVGIDIWEEAHGLVLDRMERECQGFFGGEVIFTSEKPTRRDNGEAASPYQQVPETRIRPKEDWQKLSRAEMFNALSIAQSNNGLVICAGCGRELEEPFMELDHIVPRSDRGTNDISNRILLCRPCNGRKSNALTLSGLRGENKRYGWMKNEKAAKYAAKLAERCSDKVKDGEIP